MQVANGTPLTLRLQTGNRKNLILPPDYTSSLYGNGNIYFQKYCLGYWRGSKYFTVKWRPYFKYVFYERKLHIELVPQRPTHVRQLQPVQLSQISRQPVLLCNFSRYYIALKTGLVHPYCEDYVWWDGSFKFHGNEPQHRYRNYRLLANDSKTIIAIEDLGGLNMCFG